MLSQTSQIIHLLVLTTSSEYLLILVDLARWNAICDFLGRRANIYGPIDMGMVVQFHTKNLCSRLYSTEVDFYFKKLKKSLFELAFGDFGVMCAHHL